MNHCTFYAVGLEEEKVRMIKGHTSAQDLSQNCSSNIGSNCFQP